MFQDVATYIETNSDIKPTESFSTSVWKEIIEELFETVDDPAILTIKDSLLESVPSFYERVAMKRAYKDLDHRKKRLEALATAHQIEQRSEEWYKHALEFLTASQFGDLLGAKRGRGKLVLSKVQKEEPQQHSRRFAAWTHESNPFDWGIRFEPVAKMVYEYITATKVREIGRLVHSNPELKLAASPDGIVEECATSDRLGRLVEFKAPISRIIEDGDVPKNYWYQMQIQMEVADIDLCDYFEVVLRSPVRDGTPIIEGPGRMSGYVYSIGHMQPPFDDPQPFRYIYSKINEEVATLEELNLQEGETLLETIPWDLIGYNLVPVVRSHVWFGSMKPVIKEFWDDVEKAKSGVFKLPEARKTKANGCLIKDDDIPVISKSPKYSFVIANVQEEQSSLSLV
jgi:hypothetical protein